MSRRPGSVTAVAVWAALGGLWGLMDASLTLVGGVAAGPNAAGLVLATVAVVGLVLSFAQLVLAGGLFKLVSLARAAGIVVFTLLAVLGVARVALGDLTAVVGVVLNGACAGVLLTTDAFGSERADISAGSAHRVGNDY